MVSNLHLLARVDVLPTKLTFHILYFNFTKTKMKVMCFQSLSPQSSFLFISSLNSLAKLISFAKKHASWHQIIDIFRKHMQDKENNGSKLTLHSTSNSIFIEKSFVALSSILC